MNNTFYRLLKSEKIADPADIDKIIFTLYPHLDTVKKWSARENNSIEYYNIPVAFDIENSSFYDNGQKKGCMYVWMFAIYGITVLGRTWDEFVLMFQRIEELLELGNKKRLVVYVHFLGHDFSYFQGWLNWDNVFCTAPLKPLYALTTNGIEFRCSFMLSGYKLETVGKNLHTYKCEKQTGLLNYNLKRHSSTPLTDNEKKYCIYDVKVLNAYIMECIEESGDITRIPLTKTGYVREYCRNACFYEPGNSKKKSKKAKQYREFIHRLNITSAEEYKAMKRAFQGGFVHANAVYADEILKNVVSMDICSSYPAVMLSEQFPMSSGEEIDTPTPEEFRESLQYYCVIFDIEFFDIKPKVDFDNYISVSKCWIKEKVKMNNGRLVSADHIGTTITNVDFSIINKFYSWSSFRVLRLWRYKKRYLPKDFIISILGLYEKKTELKGTEFVVEYMGKKEMLNSSYGMCVQDPLTSDIDFENGDYYDNETQIRNNDEEIQARIDKYNNAKNRFLFYPWGVFVTAYARKNITDAILSVGRDYIYSDTDSVKFFAKDEHKAYFTEYNKNIVQKVAACLAFYGIDTTRLAPKTKDGKSKPIGVFELDGKYKRFKALRAKCYLYEDDDQHINLTAAGLSKQKTKDYLVHKYRDHVFDHFTDGLEIRPDRTGKLTHTYINEEITGYLRDYTGKIGKYHEKSYTHLEPAPYTIGLSEDFTQFIYYIKNKRPCKQ